jgi:hypothetical protein
VGVGAGIGTGYAIWHNHRSVPPAMDIYEIRPDSTVLQSEIQESTTLHLYKNGETFDDSNVIYQLDETLKNFIRVNGNVISLIPEINVTNIMMGDIYASINGERITNTKFSVLSPVIKYYSIETIGNLLTEVGEERELNTFENSILLDNDDLTYEFAVQPGEPDPSDYATLTDEPGKIKLTSLPSDTIIARIAVSYKGSVVDNIHVYLAAAETID